MDYRDKLYSVYVSSHTSNLYGSTTIENIESQFSSWRYYFREFLPKHYNARILDIGCGNGGFLHFLHESGYLLAEGVDVSEEQVALSRQLQIQQIACADVFEYLTTNPDTFDVVFARDVIEHFRKNEVIPLFSAIHQALRLNGTVIVQVPNGESPISGRLRYGDFSHELAFTRGSLNQIFAATGYTQMVYRPTGPVPNGWISVIRFLLWKAIESIVRLYVLVETGSKKGVFTQDIIAAGTKQGGF